MPNLAAIGVLALLAAVPQPELREVDEGFEDVSPLASPTHQKPKDLRKPSGFDKVYEITTPTGETAFVRIDNGLVAIFNRSDYLAGTDVAFIPPNTRFHIGTQDIINGPSAQDTYTSTPASSRINTRPSTRISNRVPKSGERKQEAPQEAVIEPESQSPAPISMSGPAAIVTNEYYRRLRITQLLQSAIARD